MPFHRRRWDTQPTDPCDVLLASDGRRAFSTGAVARAAALAGPEGTVGVVTIARIYGTQFGLPHPGLLPTKAELAERQAWVADAIGGLKRKGVRAADGQVAATRKTRKKLVAVARVRSVRAVVIDETTATGWRRRVEGDIGSELRRTLRGSGIEVEIIPPSPEEAPRRS